MSNEHPTHPGGASGNVLSLESLAEFSGLSEAELQALVEHEILNPIDAGEPRWFFGSDCLLRVYKACRLRDDLELDIHAVALTLKLLDRIEALERQLSSTADGR